MKQQLLQVVGQVQHHNACAAEQLQQLTMLWQAAAGGGDSSASSAGPAAAAAAVETGVGLPHELQPQELQQMLQLCLQQQKDLEQQLVALEQLLRCPVAAEAALHWFAVDQQGSAASLGGGSGGGCTAVASFAARCGQLLQQVASCYKLLKALADGANQLALGVAAAVSTSSSAAAAAAAAPAQPAAAADGDATVAGPAGATECCAQRRSAELAALSAVAHVLSAMQLLGVDKPCRLEGMSV
jgi:hypothetical protein